MQKQNIRPETAIKILAKGGKVINREQAARVLDFMYKIANIAISNHPMR